MKQSVINIFEYPNSNVCRYDNKYASHVTQVCSMTKCKYDNVHYASMQVKLPKYAGPVLHAVAAEV